MNPAAAPPDAGGHIGSATTPGDVMTAPNTSDDASRRPPLHNDATPGRIRTSVPGLLTLLLLFVLGLIVALVL